MRRVPARAPKDAARGGPAGYGDPARGEQTCNTLEPDETKQRVPPTAHAITPQ
jgi:hypothetical protein